MRILLDTHIYLWWQDDPSLLSPAAIRLIEEPNNSIFISAAVSLEISIKSAIGKLDVPSNVMEYMEDESFLPLPISIKHTLELSSLENHHSDPFDRIMMAQAKSDKLTFITRDKQCLKYNGIKLVKG